MLSSGLGSFWWMHWISRSGSHLIWFSSWKNTQTCLRPHIHMGSGPFHIPMQGSFHFALAKVIFVLLCHNLFTADHLWIYVFRKFSVNNAWFQALCGVWGYNSPVFIFWSSHISRSYVPAPQFLALEDYNEFQPYDWHSIEYKIFEKLC